MARLENTNVRDISKQNCLDWAAKYKGSATAFNNTALVLRMVLDIAIESGVIYEMLPAISLARQSNQKNCTCRTMPNLSSL